MSDSKQIISPPPPRKLEEKTKNNEGRALKGWSIFFFVLTCISTFLVVATTALPFFIIIFGLLMGLIWFIFVVGGSFLLLESCGQLMELSRLTPDGWRFLVTFLNHQK